MQEFDYVIVGAGSAGCVLASRLSEDPSVSVCLLEDGGPDSSVLVHAPLGFAAGASVGANASKFYSEPQPSLHGRRSYQPRGKVLGGSSSVNAMMYVRGHSSDYDDWAAQGNPGWDYASVLPFFKKSENSECFGANEHHGSGGPLNVAWLRSPGSANEAFMQACEAAGLPRTPDYNGAQQEGCWPTQVTQINGERCSAAKGFLTPHLGRPNLRVITGARVQRLEIAQRRATGVHFSAGGQSQLLKARREVLLSAGAFGSPQILMLSGIGRASDLAAVGVQAQHELAGVGQNLQDHITSNLSWRSRRADAFFGISLRGGVDLLRGIAQWRRERRGLITSNVAESGAFFRTRPELARPDIELEVLRGIVDDHNRKLHLGHGYTVHVCLLRPQSRGQVTLASADPQAKPLIDPRYFSHPDDLPTLVRGTQRALEILEGDALKPYRGAMLFPVDRNDPAGIEAEIRRSADTEYHPVGTCRMGPASDPMAVVGADLRVHGVQGLRVIDASIMPTLVGGNTNAPTIMIGEKGADLVKRG
ncbi:MAG TPA: GMC family oxidoreductase N-terminal domain-containing protein [Burkholderiaceae bacterium]